MDSGFTDFFMQIPQGFILMFCGSGVLLVLVIAYSIYSRRKQVTAAPYPASAAAPVYASYDDSAADLPDLDDLASAELKSQAAAPAKPRPAGAHVVTLAGGENVEAVEVLTVLRDVGEGGLIIQIGGKAYRNPPAYADADFKRRLHNTLRDLSGAPSSPAAPPAVASEEQAERAPAAPAPAAPPSAPPVPPPAAARFDPDVPAPGDLPKFRIPDGPVVKPKRGEKLVKEPIPEINIAGSIEAFLQHKLARTPQYAGRSIHVVPASHGGVNIEVDGTYYESVAEVADEDVRQFLAATIEEWQARQ